MRKVNIIKTLSTTALMMTALQAGGDILPVVEYTNYEEVNASAVVESSMMVEPAVTEVVTPKVKPKVLTQTEGSKGNFYVGIGLNTEQSNTYRFGKEKTLGATVKMGYDVSKYLGLELRGSKSITKEDQLTHDYSVGAYVKPQYPVNKDLTLYGLVGYGQNRLTYENELAEQGIRNNRTTQNGLSYGLGVDYMLDESWSAFADATRLIDKDETKLEGKYAIKVDNITFGVAKRF